MLRAGLCRTYGAYSYGLYSYGPHACPEQAFVVPIDIYIYGPHSYGPYGYGPHACPKQAFVIVPLIWSCIQILHIWSPIYFHKGIIAMVYAVMAYVVMATM